MENNCKDIFNAAGEAVQSRPDLLIFVLLSRGTDAYNHIKCICDTVLGIASQCVLSKHVETAKPQYCANLSLKVNSKLGGSNVFLDPRSNPLTEREPTIIV